MKRIVVIAGVTGAIGSSLLSEYAQSKENSVYGISRKALPLSKFLTEGTLPHKTLICALTLPDDYEKFFSSLNYSDIDEVIYIHAMGLYPFEVSKNGEVLVESDHDGDGINDETWHLTYDAFTSAVTALNRHWQGRAKTIIFGGIADKHEPVVHQSWWKTIAKLKEWVKDIVQKNQNLSVLIFNISSVICPHEIITRPYVFVHTDADQTKWLHPYELAQFVVAQTEEAVGGFHELDKYRIKEGFDPETYYKDSEFTPRKVNELF